MTNPELPATVLTYLGTAGDADPATVAGLFTTNAIVVDDGHTYRGRDEITAWRTDVVRAFTYTSTRLRTELSGNEILVVERIEGDFPGGRVDLANRFTLDAEGQIASLTIQPD